MIPLELKRPPAWDYAGSSPTLTDCTFTNNSANEDGADGVAFVVVAVIPVVAIRDSEVATLKQMSQSGYNDY